MVEPLERLVGVEAEPLLEDRLVAVVLVGVLLGGSTRLPRLVEPRSELLQGPLVPIFLEWLLEGLVDLMGALGGALGTHGAWLELDDP